MCYPLPGPRCSNHTARRLTQALNGGDPEQIQQAQQQYNTTPAGIKALHAAGQHLEADIAAATRKAQLAAYHRSQTMLISKRVAETPLEQLLADPQAALPDPDGYSKLENLLLDADLSATDVNRVLDAIEQREQDRLVAYALTH